MTLSSVTLPAEEELEVLSTRLRALSGNPRQGLPQVVFRLVSQLTPMVNVDLLVRNELGQTLMTWRADEYYGPGWHIPGGIVRFKESFAERIAKVAAAELGCQVEFEPQPLAMNEVTNQQRDVRGHFISLLYACRPLNPPAEALKFGGGMPKNGQWRWHDRCPDDLIRVHEMYRVHIDRSISATTPLLASRNREKRP